MMPVYGSMEINSDGLKNDTINALRNGKKSFLLFTDYFLSRRRKECSRHNLDVIPGGTDPLRLGSLGDRCLSAPSMLGGPRTAPLRGSGGTSRRGRGDS